MKQLLALLTIAFSCLQAQNIEHQIVASQFGAFQVPSVGNGFAFPADSCQVSGGNKNFPAFTVGVPIKVVDSNPAQTEIDTPIAVNLNNSNCSVSMATTYSHTSFYLTSGTGGLQEAINSGQVTGGANTIILDQQWYAQVAPGTPSAVIASVHGSATLGLVDVTQTPYANYQWNGTAYAVVAPAGATIPATNNALCGTNAFGVARACTPGADVITPAFVTGSQTIQQSGQLQLNNVTVVGGAIIDTITSAKINNVIYVDGVNGAGIGVAPSAWSASTAYPQCAEVSYSGGNYLGVATSSNVTPGTNKAIWYPIPNAATPTQLDCAFYIAASEVANHNGAALRLGAGTYLSSIGLVEPTVSRAGDPVVNIYGSGRGVTLIQLSQNNGDGFPFLYLPDTSTAYAFASFTWENFTIDANFKASAVIGVYGAQQFVMKNILAENALDGSDHYIEFGDSSNTADGWTYEADIENVDLNSSRGSGSGALVTTTVSGGVPSFTVTAGGGGYNATGSDTQALLIGVSDFGRPCSSMGTTTATVASGVVTAVTSTATGCVAPLYTVIVGNQNINYGYKFSNASDSKLISSMTNGGIGSIAGMYLSNITSQMSVYKYHPESTVRGVQNYGNNSFINLQCDTIIQYCFDQEGQGGSVDVIAPLFEWNNVNMTGSSDFYFGPITGTPGLNQPVAFNIYGEQCGNPAQQTGYAHFVTSAGVVDSAVGSDSASLPAYVHDTSPMYCNQLGAAPTVSVPTLAGNTISFSNGVVGNGWNFSLSPGFISGGGAGSQTLSLSQVNSASTPYIGVYAWDFVNPTASTSSQNYNSPIMGLLGSYWNGSASAAFGINHQLTFASGSGPLATFTTTHTGTAPGAGFLYSWDGPLQTTASTGTAPLVVASTTQVANLNASSLGGATFAAPGAIGSTTPGTGAFSTLSATGGITATSDGVHAGYDSLAGNTTNPAIAANTAGDLGPNVTTFTAYALQRPSAGPSVASVLCLAAVSSSVAAESFCGVTGSGGTVVEANSPTFPAAGAASTPGVSITGAPYTGGTATTNFPQLYINDGAAVTTFSTGGTEFGINAPSGFGGHFLNFFVNGGSTRFRVDNAGDLFVAGTATLSSTLGLSGTNAPTIANGAGAGTAPGTPTVTGNNNAGVITVITGTATPTASTLVTVTFNGTLGTTPNGCSLMPRTSAAAAAAATIYTTAPSTTAFTIAVGTAALTASTTYTWSYLCL